MYDLLHFADVVGMNLACICTCEQTVAYVIIQPQSAVPHPVLYVNLFMQMAFFIKEEKAEVAYHQFVRGIAPGCIYVFIAYLYCQYMLYRFFTHGDVMAASGRQSQETQGQ